MDEFDQGTPPPGLIAPATYSFGGKPLASYSYGRRLLLRSLFTEKEAVTQVYSLSLIFTLSLTEAEARGHLFDPAGFKAAFTGWLDQSEPNYQEAAELADKILGDAQAGQVRTVESPGALPQKKT